MPPAMPEDNARDCEMIDGALRRHSGVDYRNTAEEENDISTPELADNVSCMRYDLLEYLTHCVFKREPFRAVCANDSNARRAVDLFGGGCMIH